MKTIPSETFFKLIAVNSGLDLRSARDAYYGLVKTIARELKSNRVINLPDFGEFSIRMYKERMIVDLHTKQKKKIPPTPTVKFVADYKVKKYFHDLRENGTMV